jgi:telomerase reverse transcriptase
VIWLLFSKDRASNGWVKHLLCQGFQKDISSRSVQRGENAASSIPGLLSIHPNSHVTSIKADPWPQVLALMGKEGERAMIDLLLDCGIFLAVGSGRGTYHQLSGKFDPLEVLDSLMK